MAVQAQIDQYRSNQTYPYKCKSSSYLDYHTPLQSFDCGACAPKTSASNSFAMWSCSNLADHKNTNPLIFREVV